MSKVPGYANTYVIVLETPRTGIDLQHKAWLPEYFYAHTLSKMHSSCLWVFFPPKGEKKDKIWYIKSKSSFCKFLESTASHESIRRCCGSH